jgi:hypothetical protein
LPFRNTGLGASILIERVAAQAREPPREMKTDVE